MCILTMWVYMEILDCSLKDVMEICELVFESEGINSLEFNINCVNALSLVLNYISYKKQFEDFSIFSEEKSEKILKDIYFIVEFSRKVESCLRSRNLKKQNEESNGT